MSSYKTDSKAIGGYFELELQKRNDHYHDALRLDSGRSCFALSLSQSDIKKVYLPKYICDSMLEPLLHHNIEFELYDLNENLELGSDIHVNNNERLLYVNYFGIKSLYTHTLKDKYSSSLILDNTQAFFEQPLSEIDTIYSCRKFFGVPDGGYLSTPKAIDIDSLPLATTANKCSHLLGRLESPPESHYADYQRNENLHSYDTAKKMSSITEKLLFSIDYDAVKLKREENFTELHHSLKEFNSLSIDTTNINAPMCYPLLISDKDIHDSLVKHKIYTPRYWGEVLNHDIEQGSIEQKLTSTLVPLPIDQRYDIPDMNRIITCVKQAL